jgi:hypothetical protein
MSSSGHRNANQPWGVSTLREFIYEGSGEDHISIYALCFSPDGRHLATLGSDHVVRVSLVICLSLIPLSLICLLDLGNI